MAFTSDGRTLASGSQDGTILLWDVAHVIPELGQPAEDLNGDGVVNIQDLVLVVANFGETAENDADVNGDGVVNIQDLVRVAAVFGKFAAAVGE